MTSDVTCGQCGSLLEIAASDTLETRTPCPTCGSITRNFRMKLEPGVFRLTGFPVEFRVLRNSSSLLLQAVVVPGAKSEDGSLIAAVTLPWYEIIGMLSSDPSIAFQIDPHKWEEIIAGAYHKAGFDEVILTPRSGDLGRDIIAVKRGIGSVRIIDQVKAYGPNHLVSANDVRALLGVLEADKASKGFLTTTSDFAPRLRDDVLLKPFMPSRLELINGDMLLDRLNQLAKDQ